MGKIFLFVLFCFSGLAFAESKVYSLKPHFYGMDSAGFESVSKGGEQSIKGYLTGKGGVRHILPDACEPEGGGAELIDAYSITGKNQYFVFICAWSVQHLGVGINGTQYEYFIYKGMDSGRIIKDNELSKMLSAYEGSLEGGGSNHAWYATREIASGKLLEIEAGNLIDSVFLAHKIVMRRLKNKDVEAIKAYLDSERIQQLLRDAPVSKANAVAYNDFGYALGLSGDGFLAYEILKEVEKVTPNRVVLKLNIADALWSSDRRKAKKYYSEYQRLMRESRKERLIPTRAFERLDSE